MNRELHRQYSAINNLPDFRLITIAMPVLLIGLCLIADASCSAFGKKNVSNRDGWISDNIFQMTGYGVAPERIKNNIQENKYACKAAKLNAVYKTVKEWQQKSESYPGPYYEVDSSVYSSVSAWYKYLISNFSNVASSEIVQDNGQDVCVVIIRIEHEGLKSKVKIPNFSLCDDIDCI